MQEIMKFAYDIYFILLHRVKGIKSYFPEHVRSKSISCHGASPNLIHSYG